MTKQNIWHSICCHSTKSIYNSEDAETSRFSVFVCVLFFAYSCSWMQDVNKHYVVTISNDTWKTQLRLVEQKFGQTIALVVNSLLSQFFLMRNLKFRVECEQKDVTCQIIIWQKQQNPTSITYKSVWFLAVYPVSRDVEGGTVWQIPIQTRSLRGNYYAKF